MSRLTTNTYDIQRPTCQCAKTGRTLEPGESYVATLIDVGDELERLDYSMQAWDDGARPEHLFCYWKTMVPEPNQKKSPFVDDEVLMNLLRRLEDADQPQRIAFRFVLALILMRKKLLRYDRSYTQMGPPFIYDPPPAEAEATDNTTENTASDAAKQASDDEHPTGAEPAESDPPTETEPAAMDPADMAPVEQEWWLMTPKLNASKGPMGKWAKEQLSIFNPQLNDEQIRAVADALGEILQTEL